MSHSTKVERNYDLFSSCAWYTPGIAGVFAVLGMLLLGMLLGVLIVFILNLAVPGFPLVYQTLILYPVQFLPVLIYVRLKSQSSSFFETGFALNNKHFAPVGGGKLAVLAALATLGAAVILEALNSILPEMSESLKETMELLLNGPLWVSLLSVSIMAPLFEEWLCRGVVLRGLLNCQRTDASGNQVRGLNPALAITISAIFFAAIHGNIWQGITAFLIGLLLGYVYYRTGSLKLTMLMHCVNNTFSVALSKFGGEKVAEAKSMLELMPTWLYILLFIVSAVIVLYFVQTLRRIPLERPQGNCDVILSPEEEMLAAPAEETPETEADAADGPEA